LNMEQTCTLWIMDLVFQPSQHQTCILLIKYVYMYVCVKHFFIWAMMMMQSDHDGADNVIKVQPFLPFV